ncbi:MAG: methyltransferase domain-containing protein [Parvibaculaceae bacterium]|nr:methyltransferase domain-containing protein [Parvibaculaceae bacterium]HBM88474.1 SAM-dependent methyltransferase [Rhodobiaceae bacterium]
MNATSALMDSIYRHQRHFYDFTRKYYLLGRDRLIAELAPPEGGIVLEIGCGTGRNLIKAAKRYPHALFYGLDISAEMLMTAHTEIKRAGLEDRVKVAQADAADFDAAALFNRAAFDRVFFSYSLSMIPDWEGALARGYAVTAEGGRLVIVDFGEQKRLPRWFRRLLTWWLTLFHVAPRAELGPALEELGSAELKPLHGDYARLAEVPRDLRSQVAT